MQKIRREIPYSAYLAAQAACRSLSRIEFPLKDKPMREDHELVGAPYALQVDEDDVVMTIN